VNNGDNRPLRLQVATLNGYPLVMDNDQTPEPIDRGKISPFDDENSEFHVLTNDEKQYSIWPTFVALPRGWTTVIVTSRRECLDYITEHWTDMRPNSLRERCSEWDGRRI
jgi:MbtH protein